MTRKTLDTLIASVTLGVMASVAPIYATPPSDANQNSMPQAENIREWNDVQTEDYRILEKTDETGTRIIYDFENDGSWDATYINWEPLPQDYKVSLMARTLYEHGSVEPNDTVYFGITPETAHLTTIQDHLDRGEEMAEEYQTLKD